MYIHARKNTYPRKLCASVPPCEKKPAEPKPNILGNSLRPLRTLRLTQQNQSIRVNQCYRWFQKIRILLCLSVVLLFQTACNKQPPETDEPIVAQVGDQTITLRQFQSASERYNNPPANALIEKLINEQALYQRALQQNLDQDPEIQRTWQQLLIAKLRENELEPQLASAQPTPEAIKAYYTSNQAIYTEPAQRRIALIHFQCPPNLQPKKQQELHQRAKDVRQQALAQASESSPKDFGNLAAKYSHHRASRYKGGDIGWLRSDNTRWEPEIIETAFALETTGQISELIETEQSLFLLKLLEVKDATVKPMTEVQSMIQHKLLQEKQRTTETQFIQQARDAVNIKIYKDILDSAAD